MQVPSFSSASLRSTRLSSFGTHSGQGGGISQPIREHVGELVGVLVGVAVGMTVVGAMVGVADGYESCSVAPWANSCCAFTPLQRTSVLPET